jgi:hypothetical protein
MMDLDGPTRRTSLPLAFAVALLAVVAFPTDGLAKDSDESPQALDGGYVGLSMGMFFENSRLEGEEIRGVDSTDESYDYNPDGILNAQLVYLTALSPRVRVGGGVTYFGSYEADQIPGEDQNQDDVTTVEYGQLGNFFGRAEWLIPFLDQFHFILAAQVGLSMLFPDGSRDGDLRREIQDMKDDEISVFGGPRLGVDLAPMVGFRWTIDERFALRADFGIHWQRLFLMNVNDTVNDVDYRRTWTAKVLRYNLNVGLEFGI